MWSDHLLTYPAKLRATKEIKRNNFNLNFLSKNIVAFFKVISAVFINVKSLICISFDPLISLEPVVQVFIVNRGCACVCVSLCVRVWKQNTWFTSLNHLYSLWNAVLTSPGADTIGHHSTLPFLQPIMSGANTWHNFQTNSWFDSCWPPGSVDHVTDG